MKNCSRIKNPMMLCLISFILVFSGCVSVGLQKAAPDIKTYALELNTPHQAASAGDPVSVRINAFSAVPFFNDRYLAYRSGETAYEQDFYNQLIAAPAKALQDEVSVWLKGSPLIAVVVTPDMVSEADYVIDGRLLELSGDYRVESAPKAVLKIQLTVSGMNSGDPAALFQKIYTAEVPMDHIAPPVLTEGWSEGLGQIMAEFENDLKGSVSSASR